MPELTDQYAAAAVELRGRLRTNVGGSQRDYRPGLSVTSVDKDLIEQLCDYFGLGTVDSFCPVRNPSVEVYAWNTRGPATIEGLERVTPHMIGSLREHAEYSLECEYTRPSKTYTTPRKRSG
jgi:hypothetical protein